MGNMIITQPPDIQFYGPLGLDDIPTGLKVTITLKHAKPRDTGEIQRMFFRGDFRIYQPYDGNIKEIYKKSSPIGRKYKSDNSVKTGDKNTIENTDVLTLADLKNQIKAMAHANETQEVFLKYFGTDEFHNITWAAQEGNHGSIESNKSSDEQEMENQNKKNGVIEPISYKEYAKDKV